MMSWYKRWLRPFAAWLARVVAVDVGKPDDGLIPIVTAGTELDKSWPELQQEFADALEAWRKNPLARRLVGLVTAYVVGGDGIRLRSRYRPLNRFMADFVAHPENRLLLRQADWCDELSRSGELFLTLHTNPADGLSYVRAIPAVRIESIDWRPGDYEAELRYHEVRDVGEDEGRVWYSPRAPEATPSPSQGEGRGGGGTGRGGGVIPPVMLHYAVNRPVGCVRGESDLAPILPWLRRYSRWLEDRVRLNNAIRAFLWVVKVPGRLIKEKAEQYRRPPEAGSVVVVDKDNEEWSAVTPNLQARDAQADGRAIRWMIVSGGPGTALIDLGEGEDSNLATASAMGEQRRRFLRRRQAYFSFVLADLAVQAWNRAITLGLRRGRLATLADVEVGAPDISPEDNAQLAQAAREIGQALETLRDLAGDSEALHRLAVRLVLKFAGEGVSESEFEALASGTAASAEGEEDDQEPDA